MKTDANVLIGTPAYGGMLHADYFNAVLSYQAQQLRFSVMTIGNESLITRARNTIVSEFVARPEFTHLLFLDADVALPADGLKRLLAANRDVIGAPVALKGRRPDGARIFNLGRQIGESGELLRCERIGTAALLLSRRAVDALVDDAKRAGRVYTKGNVARGGDLRSAVFYDIFRVGVVEGEYLSEDYWACEALRRLGFDVHVDPFVVTRHSGTLEA